LKAGSEEAVTFAVDLAETHSPGGALSCDKRRLFLYADTIVDLEHQRTIAKMDIDTDLRSYSTGDVGASPFNPDIFLSTSDKLRLVDIRMTAVGGRVKPVQTIDLPTRSWYFSSAKVHMKDEHSVWVATDSLLRVDLRLGLMLQYSPLATSGTTYSRNMLVDPVECRAVEFSVSEGIAPLLCCSDLSGEEWTHTIHSGVVGASALNSSLNSTQLIYYQQNSRDISSLYVYDL
jgi:hypothetical protein